MQNILHGNAYNPVHNVAAEATVNDYIAKPHKMSDHKFAYMEPINENGVLAFDIGTTFFMAFDNADDIGVITAGLSAGLFGFSLETALGKSWQYNDFAHGGEENRFATDAGNLYSGRISASIYTFDIALHGQFLNPELKEDTISNLQSPHYKINHEIWDAKGQLSLTNAQRQFFSWEINLNFLRHKSTTRTTEKNYQNIDGNDYIATYKKIQSDTTSRIEIIPEINIASTVLESAKSKVFLGLNTKIPYIIHDRIDGICSRNNQLAMYLKPNALAETALNKYLQLFGALDYELELFSWRDSYIKEHSIKSVEIHSGTASVNCGARFAYEQLALEMGFTKEFLRNPFHSVETENDITVNVGAMLTF